MKTAFEETNFKIRNPVSFCEVVDVDGQEEIIFRSGSDLNMLYENLFWTKYTYKALEDGEGHYEKEEREFIKDWRKDVDLLEYTYAVMQIFTNISWTVLLLN